MNAMKIVKHVKKDQQIIIIIVKHAKKKIQYILIQEIVKQIVQMDISLMKKIQHLNVNVQIIKNVIIVLKKVRIQNYAKVVTLKMVTIQKVMI